MNDIDEIREQVEKCTKCSLCKTRTKSVPGKGDIHSDVIFVGEAPGRNEDERGEPFVGAAGKILSAALDRIGVSRDSVYITNVVKCRPPNNRAPTADERAACAEYLEREIAAIRPGIICILGNTAFGSILGGSEITKHRGKIAKRGRHTYFITIHPAATIYNRELADVLNRDIARLFEVAREIKSGSNVTVDIEYAS